jgi:ketosteroid isomerase-like protein
MPPVPRATRAPGPSSGVTSSALSGSPHSEQATTGLVVCPHERWRRRIGGAGDHAMGGARTSRETLGAWFERVFRLFPSIGFEVTDVLVRGMPWSTRAVALVHVRAGEIDGEPYENELSQTIDLRWGRITRIHTLEDTQRLAGALERLRGAGVEEAAAPPIDDRIPLAA